jgi:hypothetical protein
LRVVDMQLDDFGNVFHAVFSFCKWVR